jgi:hypothetical protein
MFKGIVKFISDKEFSIAFWSNLLSGITVSFLIWLVLKLFTNIFKSPVIVLVHEAIFDGQNNPMYFIKVTNGSSKNIFTVTHVYVKDKNVDLEVLNKPLPQKLDASEQWETWIEKSKITDKKKVFINVRVVMSSGKIYKSRKNKSVRPAGFVA